VGPTKLPGPRPPRPRHEDLTILVSFSCDEATLAQWQELFADQTKPENTPGLDIALEQARDCAALRQREMANVSAWLGRRSASLAP